MNISNYEEDKVKQENGAPCYIDDGSFNVKRFNTPESNIEIEEIKKKRIRICTKRNRP